MSYRRNGHTFETRVKLFGQVFLAASGVALFFGLLIWVCTLSMN